MAAAWRRGSTSDLSSQAGEEREDIMALTQSLSIPRERLTSPGGAGERVGDGGLKGGGWKEKERGREGET